MRRNPMDFSNFPHKNLILSGLFALTIIGVGFFMNRTPIYKQDSEQVDTNEPVDFSEIDSDNDGLSDWEENVYGSDPLNSDSDGDGTLDGIEVAVGRNPTIVGPNDKLVLIQDPNFATSSTDVDGLRKEFFTKFLAAQGDEIRETTYRDLIKGFNPKKYTPTNEYADLNITGDNSPEALRAYGNAFGIIIDKYTSVHSLRTEEEILADGLKTKNDETLKELQLLTAVYQKFSLDLRALKTPSGLAPSHLLIVNGYDGMSRGLLGMQHLFSDPINGAAGYQTYTKTRLDVTKGYSEVFSFLSTHGIVFTENEPGYPFTHIIAQTTYAVPPIQ